MFDISAPYVRATARHCAYFRDRTIVSRGVKREGQRLADPVARSVQATFVRGRVPAPEPSARKGECGARMGMRSTMGMKVVGHRGDNPDPLVDVAILLRTINRLRGARLVPTGTYRFGSHEEAHRWMMRVMAALPDSGTGQRHPACAPASA